MGATDWAERRREFLDERRRSSRERYDTIIAPGFDQEWGRISPSHASCIDHLLGLTRVQGTVLDAACGTGKYWSSVLGSGRTLVGLDQSSGMLHVARSKHPEVPCGCVALQHIAFDAVFDAVICVDALENVGPEDWPTVVGALAAAVRPGAPLYLTVELADAAHLEQAYEWARAEGHPVVPGEDFDGIGYHFHPSRAQVLPWLAGAGLEVLEEIEGDGYWHLILGRRRPPHSARRAAARIDGTDEVGLPLTVLLETGHVLRTQDGIGRASVLDALLGVATRRNVEVLGGSRQAVTEALTRARGLPGAPLADALIAATVRGSGARPLSAFDAGLARHGIDVAAP